MEESKRPHTVPEVLDEPDSEYEEVKGSAAVNAHLKALKNNKKERQQAAQAAAAYVEED